MKIKNRLVPKVRGTLWKLEIGERSSFRFDVDRTLLLFYFKVTG
ncbi:TPA: hypothetical protein ACGO4J_002037 [Streptococcus suis]